MLEQVAKGFRGSELTQGGFGKKAQDRPPATVSSGSEMDAHSSCVVGRLRPAWTLGATS